jgi:hypothetical protein
LIETFQKRWDLSYEKLEDLIETFKHNRVMIYKHNKVMIYKIILWYEIILSNTLLIEITQGYERLVSLEEYIKGKYNVANEDLVQGETCCPFENDEESIID